ncbi:hypothetical protein [Mucilaginibacter sp. NFX135]
MEIDPVKSRPASTERQRYHYIDEYTISCLFYLKSNAGKPTPIATP